MIRVTGHDSGVLLLHLVCECCTELSLGFPNAEAPTVDTHPTRRHALEDGWQEQRRGNAAIYVCPTCVKQEKQTMAKRNGKNGTPVVGTKEIEILVALEPNVLEYKRNKLIDVELELDILKAKKREVSADASAKIKDKNEERAALLEVCKNGRQRMTVKVVEQRDDRRGCMLIKRADNGVVIDERPYSAAERQLDLEETLRQKAETPAPKKSGAKGAKASKGRTSKAKPAADDGIGDDDYQPETTA